MVQVKENELIITIKTSNGINTLTELQSCILDAMAHYQSEGDDNFTISTLGDLLKELMPTFEQYKSETQLTSSVQLN